MKKIVPYTLLQLEDLDISDGDQSDRFVVDNVSCPAGCSKWPPLYDKLSGEEIHFYYALVTKKDEHGDRKLASLISQMKEAGVHSHTYDARSGAKYRITRVGATGSRLGEFADAVHYINELNPERVMFNQLVILNLLLFPLNIRRPRVSA